MKIGDKVLLFYDGRPTVIDLFSGCGGFSLGFIKAGWRVIASIEWDYWAHITYCNNIPHMQQAPLHVYSCDIRNLSGREILMNAGIKEVVVIDKNDIYEKVGLTGKDILNFGGVEIREYEV